MKLIALGDNVIDYYHNTQECFPGGNAVNVAVHAARLGAQAEYLGSLGDDKMAHIVEKALRENGVDISHCPVLQGRTTKVCSYDVVNGERSFIEVITGESWTGPLQIGTQELDELKKAVDIYDSTVKTGNETLDVLLAERSIVCKGRGIQLDYIADGAKLDFLKPGEVYSLFGNALDNAIEAVTPLEPDRRYIGLQVRAERGMLLIRMENCAAEPLHFVDGLPQTTKGDARWHGFGVKSIRRIVQQHGGTLTMQAQDGMFRLVALLPLK